MAAVTSFAKLLDAYEWVSAGREMEAQAYVSRASGRVFLSTRSGEFGDLEDALPEDIDDETLYLPVPGKYELDLGKPLVFGFVREHLPAVHERVDRIFSRRGAYGQFKSLLEDAGCLEDWYAYESAAVEAALRGWAREHDLALDDEVGAGCMDPGSSPG